MEGHDGFPCLKVCPELVAGRLFCIGLHIAIAMGHGHCSSQAVPESSNAAEISPRYRLHLRRSPKLFHVAASVQCGMTGEARQSKPARVVFSYRVLERRAHRPNASVTLIVARCL